MSTAGLPSAVPAIAIVGSGPSGCYAAQFLRKKWRDAEIVMFDRLEQPYGLIRYGVAPDHVGTKAIARQFDRLFERENVSFVGQIEIGAQITLDELRSAFDVVVLATGLYADRPLGVPGGDLAGIYGSGRITRLINGHPDEDAAGFRLGSRVVIVGHGNVAIDILRLLLTPPEDLRALGVADEIVSAISAPPVEHIDIVGRSLPFAAKFDTVMVRELAKIGDVRFLADGIGRHGGSSPNCETHDRTRHEAITELVDGSPSDASRVVHFHFGWTPRGITGSDVVTGISFGSTDGSAETLELKADSVCTAIGFVEASTAAIRRSEHETETTDLDRGILAPGVFCVGWIRRGPRGTIPENRVDARMVVDSVAALVGAGDLVLGKPGIAALKAHIERIRSAKPALTPSDDPAGLRALVKDLP
ncbi:MAG TPA: FAD-dependent oxidoreductase, partial [Nitrolancea sp.]|nr:FAD-dependent oxidoreductase [Nitrolancea sp.]